VVDTKANQAGHYECIKNSLDATLRNQIIWKTNEPGRVPVRDVVALAWIPLSLLQLPSDVSKITPVHLYSSKAKCMEAFVELMENVKISNYESGRYELKNTKVASALSLLKDLPKLYDLIYTMLPQAYNEAGGKFGRIGAVKMYDPKKYKEDPKSYLKNRPLTPFYAGEVDYQSPEGFITPLVYALSALIEEKDGKIVWKVDPYQFVKKNLGAVVQQYKGVLDLSQWDPQKVGKSAVSYAMAKQQFEHFLLTQAHQAALL
jgi:hypothetical protein